MKKKSFRNNIRLLRHMKNQTISELADELDISISFLSSLENERSIPKLDFAHLIADYFGIPLDELFYTGQENVLLNRIKGKRPNQAE